jgi:hypothetical protein
MHAIYRPLAKCIAIIAMTMKLWLGTSRSPGTAGVSRKRLFGGGKRVRTNIFHIQFIIFYPPI